MDMKKMKLTYSNYGHPAQLLWRAGDDSIEEMSSQAPLLGLPSGKGEKYERTIEVEKGDKILIGKYAGTDIKIDGEEYIIMKQEDVMGIFKN